MGTAGIFLQAPLLYDTDIPIDILSSKVAHVLDEWWKQGVAAIKIGRKGVAFQAEFENFASRILTSISFLSAR